MLNRVFRSVRPLAMRRPMQINNFRYFSSATNVSVNSAMMFESVDTVSEIRTINSKRIDDTNISLKITSLRLGINEAFKVSHDDTFESLAQSLAEKGVQNVTFHDGNGNLFSQAEKVKDWLRSPVVLNVDYRPFLVLNMDPENSKFQPSFENLDIDQNRDKQAYANYCNHIGIDHNQEDVLSGFIGKLHSSLGDDGMPMTNQQLVEPKLDRDQVLKNLELLSMNYAKSIPQGDVKYVDLKATYKKKMEILQKIEDYRNSLESGAAKRGKILGLGLVSFIFAEMVGIGYGTYEAFSWDIMEPISYVISLVNMTAGFGWYAFYVKNDRKQTPPEWYAENYKQKKLNKYLQTIKADNDGEEINPEQLLKECEDINKIMKKHLF